MDVNMLTLTLDADAQQAVVDEKKVPGCSADCALTLLLCHMASALGWQR
jgi:hypothetical protein